MQNNFEEENRNAPLKEDKYVRLKCDVVCGVSKIRPWVTNEIWDNFSSTSVSSIDTVTACIGMF